MATTYSPQTYRKKTLRERFSTGSVGDSPDLERVLSLPRRDKPDVTSLIYQMTFKLKTPEGTQMLREHQAWTLWEAPQVGGAMASLSTGVGKTLIGMLMPMVWPKPNKINPVTGKQQSVRAVLFIPSDLNAQFHHEWKIYGRHWVLPNLAGHGKFVEDRPMLHVITYSQLSNPKSSALLEQIQPDLVMGDEIAAFRNFNSSRTIRFRRFIGQHPDTAVLGWDATMTSDSIADFWHLFAMALDDGSPTPLEESEMRKWAMALDADSEKSGGGYFLPGELMKLCEGKESARSGFRRRMIDTRGIINSEDNMLGIPLVFAERRPPPMPEKLREMLKLIRRKPADGGWKRPDGETLRQMTEVVACARQISLGFYLRWRYPHGEPQEQIDDWFLKRQVWNRELRAILDSPRVHMDSPKLCENAAERWYDGGCTGCKRGPLEQHHVGCRDVESHPLWPAFSYPLWRAVENTVHHVVETVWESDWLLHDMAAWGKDPGIIWVDHPAVGHALEKLTGFRYFGGGDEANEEILKVDGSQSIICSMNANRRGKNLQMFNRNLITAFPASNAMVDQTLGRTYRSGQSAPQVDAHYYLHVPELSNAFDTARVRAKYVFETFGTPQKLIFGQGLEAA